MGKVLLRRVFIFFISCQLVSATVLAETTNNGHEITEFESVEDSSPTTDDGSFDVAVLPVVAAVIGIFARAAIHIGKRQIQRAFNEHAARTAVVAINQGRLRKLTNSICYSVEAAGRTRVVLGPDRRTALFAGSHAAYDTFLKTEHFSKICRSRAVT